jgi:hypothetical protein
VDDNIRVEPDYGRGRSVALPAGGPDGEAASRAGRDWGWASLVLGAVFALMVLPGLQLTRELAVNRFAGFSPSERRLAALAGYGGVMLILLLVVAAIAFGIISMLAAGRRRQPIALGLAGVLLGGLDFFMWLGVGLAWHLGL